MHKVTCLMPTFNRVSHPSRCVDESLEAFLRQDYDNRELVIFNDCPQQTIKFDHPLVKVINVPDRSSCLSHALNRAAEHATGDILTLWTDDDIRLPWTLTVSVAAMVPLDDGRLHYEHATIGPHFYSVQGQIVSIVQSAVYQTGLFTRRLFDELGGYMLPLTQDHDEDMDMRARRLGRSRDPLLISVDKAFLIYRWGDGHYHLSGQQPTFRGDPAQYQAQAARPITGGEFTLQPTWLQDYVAQSKAAVAKMGSV